MPTLPSVPSPKTTWYGGAGEMLKAGSYFVPPPFNLIPAGIGTMLTMAAFYFAKDRDRTITAEATEKSQTIPPPKVEL